MITKELDEDILKTFQPSELGLVDLGESLESASSRLLKSSHKSAVYVLGKLVAICGININETKTEAHIWMIASDLLYINPIASFENLTYAFRDMFKHYPELKYVYTYNLPELQKPLRILKSMGFKEAEIVEGFIDNKKRILMILEV